MYHFFEAITNTSGDSLVGFRVALRTADNAVVPIYADQSGTPIAAVSRIDNVALTNTQGNVSLFVENGTYDILISGPDGTLYETIREASFETGEQGEPGKDAPLAQVASGTTTAEQTRFPESGPIIDIKGAEFNATISVVDVSLNGAIIAPGIDYTYDGGSTGIVFTSAQPAGVVVVVIGQPQIGGSTGGGGTLGSDEVDVASYPGTSVSDDPNRFDHDNQRFRNAQLDVKMVGSANYGKAVRLFPDAGIGRPITQDRDGNPVPQLTGADAKFNARFGEWWLDSWSQNGRFEPDNASAVLVDNKNDPGNWMPGVVIRAGGGVRIRRAPRYHHRPYILCCDPVPTPATTVNGVDTQEDVYVGNRIEGYPTVFGENHWRGYGQHANDVQVNAVTDFYAELIGLGSRSDVLYIGAGSVGGGAYNRHNKRVKYHVIADGYNKNNRNVVSTIDVDGEEGFIEARRFCKPGGPGENNNMDPNTGVGAPGVHDAEPNASFTTEPIYRNSTVIIKCEDVGSAGALFLPDNNSFPGFEAYNIKRFVVTDGSGHGGYIWQYGSNPTIPYNVEIDMRVSNSTRPYEALSGEATITGSAIDCPQAAYHGYFGFGTGGVLWDDFTFTRCGNASGQVVENRGWDGGGARKVAFRKCLNVIGIRNMPQDNPAQITRNLSFDQVDFDPGMVNAFYTDTTHDLRPGSIYESNVRLNGNSNFRWPVVGSTVRSIPTTGQYRQGDVLYITGEPGSPRTIMALTTNAAGTVPTFGVQDYVQPFAAPVASGWNANFFTLTNILNSPNGVLVAQAPMARAVATGTQTEYGLQARVPSGHTGIYFGMSYTQNPTSFSDIYFGAWLLDQTGGVGRVVGVAQGANAGTPVAIDYTDRINVSMIAGNASVVSVLRANGTSVNVFTSGIPNTPFYPVILMGTPGERVIML